MVSRAIQERAAATIWGVQHNQGINWFDTERSARQEMAHLLAYEHRRQPQAAGKIRLLTREIGPAVEVENPYVSTAPDASKEAQ